MFTFGFLTNKYLKNTGPKKNGRHWGITCPEPIMVRNVELKYAGFAEKDTLQQLTRGHIREKYHYSKICHTKFVCTVLTRELSSQQKKTRIYVNSVQLSFS